MAYFILLSIAMVLTSLFFLLVNYASKCNLGVIERKTAIITQQVILRIIVAVIGFGMIYFISYLKKIIFITPKNGYNMEVTGINIFSAIGLVIIVFSLLICFDYVLFPQDANKKTGNPRNFHLGFKLRPKLMTVLFFASTCLVLMDMLNYTYYKTGGEIVISEEWGSKKTHYFEKNIQELNINSYKGGRGGTFKELIITFSDGRVMIAKDDSEGSDKLLSEWRGDIIVTSEE